MKTPRSTKLCQLPRTNTVAGRSSTITNAFFNAIIPVFPPEEDEVMEALEILEIDCNDLRCAYCGVNKATEWDHLHATIDGQKPTGYVTEIANLVPACGKCNQSKGNSPWKTWMRGTAKLSPAALGVPNLETLVSRLERYETEKKARRFNFEALIKREMWEKHKQNLIAVQNMLKTSQKLASEIKATLQKAVAEEPIMKG